MIKIKVYGTGCPKCSDLTKNAETAAKELGVNYEIIKEKDIKKIMEAGIIFTPALEIDGVVKSAGKLLSAEEIKGFLK